MNRLDELRELARNAITAERNLKEAEHNFEIAKENLRSIVEDKLPSLMGDLDLSTFTTNDGFCIEVQQKVQASVPATPRSSEGWKKRSRAIAFLDENFPHVLKRKIVVDVGLDEMDFVRSTMSEQLGREVKAIEEIHPQTLKALCRSMLEEGVEFPTEDFNLHVKDVVKITGA